MPRGTGGGGHDVGTRVCKAGKNGCAWAGGRKGGTENTYLFLKAKAIKCILSYLSR